MRISTLLFLVMLMSPAAAQNKDLGTLTVADIQKMYELETDKEEAKSAIQVYFNGYGVGFVHGITYILLYTNKVNRDVSKDFVNCVQNSDRQFYEMLGVTDSRLELNLSQFALIYMRDHCQSIVNTILKKDKKLP